MLHVKEREKGSKITQERKEYDLGLELDKKFGIQIPLMMVMDYFRGLSVC